MPYASQYRVYAPAVEVLISQVVFGSAATSATLSGIPQNYSELRIEMVARSDRAGQPQDQGRIRVGNGTVDSGNNYNNVAIETSQTLVEESGVSSGLLGRFCWPGATAAASVFGAMTVRIPQYTNTSMHKLMYADGGFIDGTNDRMSSSVSRWASTSAINIITVFPLNGPNWVAGSVFRLYGVGPR